MAKNYISNIKEFLVVAKISQIFQGKFRQIASCEYSQSVVMLIMNVGTETLEIRALILLL